MLLRSPLQKEPPSASSGLTFSCVGLATFSAFWLLAVDWILRAETAMEPAHVDAAILAKNALFAPVVAIWAWSIGRRLEGRAQAAEARATLAEERLRPVTRLGQEAFWTGRWDAGRSSLSIDFANDAFFRIWEIEVGLLGRAGRDFFRRALAEDRERLETRFRAFVDSRSEQTMEMECRIAGGPEAPRWVWLRLVKGRAEPDGSAELSCCARDISDWRAAEQERQDSERLFRSLFDNSRDGIALCSPDGSFIDANVAFFELTGYSWEELRSMSFQSLTSEGHAEEENSRFEEEVWERGFSEVYEKQCRRKDGQTVTVSSRVCALGGDEGAPAGFFAIVRDIELERRHREELTFAKDLAESASEAKNRFLTVVSQELRTPLNPVIGYADLLLSRELGEMERGFIQIIRDSALHMSRLTSDIIEFARIESGESTIEETPFRIPELLESVAEEMRETVEAKGNTLECQYHWKVSAVLGDKERIRKILTNLLSNASRFTKSGVVTLSCGLLSGEGKDAVFRFTVRDTGVGIPESLKRDIFDPFRHGSHDFGFGAGLGLAICRQLAQSMDGAISLESKLGSGTAFYVDLPLPVVLQRDAGPLEAFAPGERARAFKVLLVEDDAANLNYAQALLGHMGCAVAIARDGEESLELLVQDRFDLVLMDLGLPRMDGFETIEILRAREGPNQSVPVIALTARVSEAARARCKATGINDFLAKPVTATVFQDVLNRWLSQA